METLWRSGPSTGFDPILKPGVIYGLVGPNRAEKTITLNRLANLLPPDGGRFFLLILCGPI